MTLIPLLLALCGGLLRLVAKSCGMSIIAMQLLPWYGLAWLAAYATSHFAAHGKKVTLLLQVVLVSTLWLWQHRALLLRHLLCCPLRYA